MGRNDCAVCANRLVSMQLYLEENSNDGEVYIEEDVRLLIKDCTAGRGQSLASL